MFRFAARVLVVCSLAACPVRMTAAEPPPADVEVKAIDDRIKHYTFRSGVLNKTMAFSAVFPEGYDASKRDWPVLFLLHGLGRHERTLIEDPDSREKLLAQPYVVILPKGENGWYFDSPFDARRQYASYLDEVVALSERLLPISRERRHRAIGGWSAGGFGSVWACLRRPGSFSTLATIIAVVDYPAPGVRFPIPQNTFGDDPAEWPKFNPLTRAAELKDLNILLVIGDKASDAVMNERLSTALSEASLKHDVVHVPGGHTFPTVQAGLGPVLDFARDHIMPSKDAPSPSGTTRTTEPTAPARGGVPADAR